tara:strand:- start:184 stop:1311 length:1128 start_codon:yes stop_codon:yes gene_type:complete
MKYLINTPFINNLEKKYVNQVLKSGWLSSNGEHTKIFEKKICNYLKIKHALAIQSGTAAIHLALKTFGCKPGDNVILPNYSCVSNLSAVSQCGANPIIVEVERETLGLDYKCLKEAIKKFKPKIIQLVHVYGCPAKNTIEIKKLCKKNKIFLLEDFSESLGAMINNKKVGKFGDISIFSIRSEKMIGVGEGGVILSDNTKIYNKFKTLASRNSPFRRKIDPYWKKYFCSGEGYNYLLPHLLGAIGRAQIEKFEKKILKRKIQIGQSYRKYFNSKDISLTQNIPKNFKSVHWLNSIFFKNKNSSFVKKLGRKLEKKGIEVRSGFWPLNKLNNFNSKYIGSKNVSLEIFNKSLVLPSNINLNNKDILYFRNIIEKNI